MSPRLANWCCIHYYPPPPFGVVNAQIPAPKKLLVLFFSLWCTTKWRTWGHFCSRVDELCSLSFFNLTYLQLMISLYHWFERFIQFSRNLIFWYLSLERKNLVFVIWTFSNFLNIRRTRDFFNASFNFKIKLSTSRRSPRETRASRQKPRPESWWDHFRRHPQLLTPRYVPNVKGKKACFGNLGTELTRVFTKVRPLFEDVKPTPAELYCS
jgi:hypothetical protein